MERRNHESKDPRSTSTRRVSPKDSDPGRTDPKRIVPVTLARRPDHRLQSLPVSSTRTRNPGTLRLFPDLNRKSGVGEDPQDWSLVEPKRRLEQKTELEIAETQEDIFCPSLPGENVQDFQ